MLALYEDLIPADPPPPLPVPTSIVLLIKDQNGNVINTLTITGTNLSYQVQ